jgi:hypothetical protein
MFAALPALLGVVVGERRGISGWGYYALVGIAIAALGFLTQHVTETPGQATILHNYALTAFLTAGLAGGFVYWLLSGRYVTGRVGPPREPQQSGKTISPAAPHKA